MPPELAASLPVAPKDTEEAPRTPWCVFCVDGEVENEEWVSVV